MAASRAPGRRGPSRVACRGDPRAPAAAAGGLLLLALTACGGVEPGPPPDGRPAAETAAAGAPPPPAAVLAGELRPGGEPVTAVLGPGDAPHRYRLPLEAGRFVRLIVDQEGVDAAVALEDPDGALIVETDRTIGAHAPEPLLAVSRAAGDYALRIRTVEGSGRGRYRIRVAAPRPAGARDRRAAEAFIRFCAAGALEGEPAIAGLTEALAAWRELGEASLEGEAALRLARLASDPAAAADLYRTAAAAFERAGEPASEAIARASLGVFLDTLGDDREATEQLSTALARARQAGDAVTEARALYNLARTDRRQGELQSALDHYEEALELWPESSGHSYRARTLHNLGVLHARFLGDAEGGRDLLEAALEAWPEGFEHHRGTTLNQLGQLAYEAGRLDEARRRLEPAWALRRGRDPCGAAVALARLAVVEQALGERASAAARLSEALAAVDGEACADSEVTVRLLAGELAELEGDHATALARYRGCLALYRERGDRTGRVETLTRIARVERALGRPEAALAASGEALDVHEGVRPTILREDLRISFFAGVQDLFDLQIGVLLDLGRPEQAWIAAEAARARALRDLLADAGAGLRRDLDPALAARERELLRRLNALEDRRLDDAVPEARRRELGRRADAVVAELERVRGEVRRGRGAGSAGLAADPGPRTLAEVQGLLAPDAVLLEYRLGEPESFLWAVTARSLSVHRLPSRREIEELAVEAANLTVSLQWPGANPPALCRLGALLLGPVAAELAQRPLVLVPDGALHGLPFAALPDPAAGGPCAERPPLVAAHAISHLPSAAVLADLRRRSAGRAPAPGRLAVIADPVYEASDPRLDGAGGTAAGAAGGARSGDRFRRLPHSGAEARAILGGLPASARTFRAIGPAARKAAVLDGALGEYRIVHFATHGRLDAERPLLSFLALSRFDARGRPLDGDLTAHEIYGLDLPAELVVLSACDTARGRDVPGEGRISGLPRAFLYAGATRVVVSLWAVPDAGTRELMTRFYRGLFERRLAPAQALQAAQLAHHRAGLAPYRWAGFVLQGDSAPLPPDAD